MLEIGGHRVALRLAPNNKNGYGYGSRSKAAGTPATPADRSARLALFVQELVADGVIPGKAVRNQLQVTPSPSDSRSSNLIFNQVEVRLTAFFVNKMNYFVGSHLFQGTKITKLIRVDTCRQ